MKSSVAPQQPSANNTVPIQSSNANPREIPSDADLLVLYNNGTKRHLKSTRKLFLLALCTVKFGTAVANSYKQYDKEKILDILHEAVSLFTFFLP